MTDKHRSEKRIYTDENGSRFEMDIMKHFTLGDKQYVLAREVRKHHHHGENCDCHDHHHEHSSAEPANEDFYVFEWCDGTDGPDLLVVSDETLQALEPLLAGM
ncbi:MAG: DUF1292 domain-containing protein [Acetobacterium woodii]|nr:DUF1292 domain-containing protein [Acetobacterium woodii]